MSGYVLKNGIGQGTFGTVVNGYSIPSMRNVAVKFIEKDFRRLALREVHILREISHLDSDKCNLVKFFHSFKQDKYTCLVMEKLDINLFDFMVNKCGTYLPLPEMRVILNQTLVALNALKSIGIVHLDIKPDNIMFCDQRQKPLRVKLIDFGLAAHVSKIKQGCRMQPTGYRAPEIILGLPVNEAADMWSLGCVAAFLYIFGHLYPIKNSYEELKIITQMQGQPADHLLDSGMYTGKFFWKKNNGEKHTWQLKTREEYITTNQRDSIEYTGISKDFTCLDDVINTRRQPKTDLEWKDNRAFVSLLKRMLHTDPAKRITPTEALGHRFLKMKYFYHNNTSDPYVESSHNCMKYCPPLAQSIIVPNLITSSEPLEADEPMPSTSYSFGGQNNPGTNANKAATTKHLEDRPKPSGGARPKIACPANETNRFSPGNKPNKPCTGARPKKARDKSKRTTPRDEPKKTSPRDEPKKTSPRDKSKKTSPGDEPKKTSPGDEHKKTSPRNEPKKCSPGENKPCIGDKLLLKSIMRDTPHNPQKLSFGEKPNKLRHGHEPNNLRSLGIKEVKPISEGEKPITAKTQNTLLRRIGNFFCRMMSCNFGDKPDKSSPGAHKRPETHKFKSGSDKENTDFSTNKTQKTSPKSSPGVKSNKANPEDEPKFSPENKSNKARPGDESKSSLGVKSKKDKPGDKPKFSPGVKSNKTTAEDGHEPNNPRSLGTKEVQPVSDGEKPSTAKTQKTLLTRFRNFFFKHKMSRPEDKSNNRSSTGHQPSKSGPGGEFKKPSPRIKSNKSRPGDKPKSSPGVKSNKDRPRDEPKCSPGVKSNKARPGDEPKVSPGNKSNKTTAETNDKHLTTAKCQRTTKRFWNFFSRKKAPCTAAV